MGARLVVGPGTRNRDLALVGYTLGASVALQYGLDYPEEVKGLVLMTVAARPKVRAPGTYEMRLRAVGRTRRYTKSGSRSSATRCSSWSRACASS